MRSLSPRFFAGLFFLSLMVVMTACETASPATLIGDQSYAPLNLRHEAERYEFTTPASMCSAILTAEVKTITHGASHWNTPDGLRPHITTAQNMSVSQTIVNQGFRIYTPVSFATLHVLRDLRQRSTKEFVTVGGQVQQDQYWIDPFPQLKESDHYLIVFAPGSQLPGKGKVQEWLVVYNAFPVDAQGMITLQQAGSPKEPGPGAPQPEVKTTLTALQQQLSACH